MIPLRVVTGASSWRESPPAWSQTAGNHLSLVAPESNRLTSSPPREATGVVGVGYQVTKMQVFNLPTF